MQAKAWRYKETEISFQVGDDCYNLIVEHSGHIEPARYGPPEDALPEDVDIEIHRLLSGCKNGCEITGTELISFLDKYDGLIGDEILSKILD